MSYSHEVTAKEYRKDAARYYYESRKYARRASDEYKFAAQMQVHANWLTNRSDLWESHGSPADHESFTKASNRLGDTFLRISFENMDRARFYTDLAKRYDRMG